MPSPPWLKPLYRPEYVPLVGNVTLTNVGTAYDATALSQILGVAQVDFGGNGGGPAVASIEFAVWVNKVGTGTQDWQLWNVTDGAQIGVVSDAGAAGVKRLAATINSGIPAGVKTVRVRAKSSTAADDPVFLGGLLTLK